MWCTWCCRHAVPSQLNIRVKNVGAHCQSSEPSMCIATLPHLSSILTASPHPPLPSHHVGCPRPIKVTKQRIFQRISAPNLNSILEQLLPYFMFFVSFSCYKTRITLQVTIRCLASLSTISGRISATRRSFRDDIFTYMPFYSLVLDYRKIP